MSTAAAPQYTPEALGERLFGALLGTMELACIHVGDRLGLYAALADGGPQTSAALAARAGLDERYVREWLEQQAVAAILVVDDAGAPAAERRYSLPEGHREALLDPDSLLYATSIARAGVGTLAPIDRLIAAFRTGEGVPYPAYGPSCREGIAAFNRPMFVNQLVQEWTSSVPEIDSLLRPAGARVADMGCGQGWSAVSLAAGYPGLRVDGFDSDAASIEAARRLAEERGVADRVRFFVQDVSQSVAGDYDLVTIFEALHDMAHPVEALRTARRLLRPGGLVLIADERVAERFTAPGDEIERLNYGFSVLHCLAVGREDEHAAATGTVIRPATVDAYAREAGFAGAEILPVEHDFWRFYLLRA
jgi:SAM-dependent methyltransferase